MRYNPCGYIVDWARVPYRTQCRFFRDNDRTDTVRWAEANAGALTLPFESVICNAYNEIDHYLDAPVGEVYGARRPYTGQRAPKGLFSGHYCGTEEDFAQGGRYEPEKEPVKYGNFGWPLCCDPPRALVGGAAGSGRADFRVYPPLARLSGAGAGGQADYTPVQFIDGAEGGVEVGGQAGDFLAFFDGAEGGVEVGGEAGDLIAFFDGAEGGVEVGGEAGDVLAFIDGAEGGVEVGGEAGDVFNPGGPGNTCATAQVSALHTNYNNTVPFPGDQWFVFPIPNFAGISVTAGGVGGTPNADYYFGDDCSTLFLWYSGPLGNQSSFNTTRNFLFVHVNGVPAVGINYNLRAD